ncbi:hypothetical protein EYF80_025201 [Liparis tanakae]|uniref:Uncharacterized protein n=1 Tax=Liparis tanakae TaxID=230148 RepID=A0A4Z2HI36_9TELE|nr:hypothetical protein EYF80_025201 [Liparis tanakae]
MTPVSELHLKSKAVTLRGSTENQGMMKKELRDKTAAARLSLYQIYDEAEQECDPVSGKQDDAGPSQPPAASLCSAETFSTALNGIDERRSRSMNLRSDLFRASPRPKGCVG